MTTFDRIAAIIADIAPGHPPATPATRLDEILDSLDCIEMVVAVEDAFGVEVSCAQRIDLQTVGCVAALVDRASRPLALAA